ncbi:MAG: BlaI/MecI/CopY family transcriptional regulator [Mariniblastus sp.]|nr:BlaI/MecI/CopY family transcriptional regulator [Mariniblastus sp.]
MFTELEWQILKSVWQAQPVTSREIIQNLSSRTDSSPATIKTVLHRLVDKDVLRFRRKGNRYLYSAQQSPDRSIGQACNQLVRVVFDGQPAAAVACLLSSSNLSSDQLAYLQELLVDIRVTRQQSERRESDQRNRTSPVTMPASSAQRLEPRAISRS